jgi:hypothetical protein
MKDKKSATQLIDTTEAAMPEPVLCCWQFYKQKLQENNFQMLPKLPQSDRQHLLSSLSGAFLNSKFSAKNLPDPASMFMYGVAAHRLLFMQKRAQLVDAIVHLRTGKPSGKLANRFSRAEIDALTQLLENMASAVTTRIAKTHDGLAKIFREQLSGAQEELASEQKMMMRRWAANCEERMNSAIESMALTYEDLDDLAERRS